MPRNTFRRPQPVARVHDVPRHGAPLPIRKLEAKAITQPKPEAPITLPALEALLKPTRT